MRKNYRPVSQLSDLSKVFRKPTYSHINLYLRGFCKKHHTHHVLLNMIENWKINLNKRNKLGAIFMALSKAFSTLDHSLKREAYSFDSVSLEFMKKYLTNRDVRSDTVLVY